MIFESHAHYDDEQFDKDRDELLLSMPENEIGTIVNIGVSVESCKQSLELTKKYPYVYASMGIHPDEVGSVTDETICWLKEQSKDKKVVAIGEIGLDYYWDNEPRGIQKKWFQKQIEIAEEQKLPVIIHSRDAAADTMEIMKTYAGRIKGVIHCFSYSPEQAREYVEMGFYIGVGGVITFKNAKKLKQVVEEIPLESIVIETDSPYLAPAPNRGKRNSSLNLKYIAEEIGRIKRISYEDVVIQTEKNAKKLYQLL